MKAPWHLWAIGIVSLLWNAMGAFDYVMTNSGAEAYMSAFTPEQLDFFTGFPTWVTAAWAIAVWFGVLGSVLLLLRSGLAVLVFAVSFVGMVITSLHNFLLAEVSMADISGPGAMWFSLAIFVVAILLVLYARRQRQGGVLR